MPAEKPGDDSRPDRAVLDGGDVSRVIDRMAHQILEKTGGAGDAVLMGIPTRGVALARRLAARIAVFEPVAVPVGELVGTREAKLKKQLGRNRSSN